MPDDRVRDQQTYLRETEQSNERLRWILGSITDGYLGVDGEWRFTDLNPVMERMFGQAAGRLRGRVLWEEYPEAINSEWAALLHGAARDRRPAHGEIPNPIDPGWLEVHAYPRSGGLEVFLRNITDRKRAEAALRSANDTLEQRVAERTRESEDRALQLAALSRQLADAEQRERARLARVLHDDLQQVLVAARVQVGVLARKSAAGEDVSGLARQTERLIEEAIDTSRSLSHELSPALLRDQGLVAALSWLARRFGEKHGIRVLPIVDDEAEPQDDAVRILLYEVAREFLLNVVKHSGSLQAELHLHLRDGMVRLEVADTGKGFEPGATQRRLAGFGLLQVRERIEYLGGRLEVASRPGHGARVAVMLPSTLADADQPREKTPQPGESKEGTPRIRVVLADDHQMVRTGLVMALRLEQDIDVVAEAADGNAAVLMTKALGPDVVVMDVSMPVMGGAEATRRIRSECPSVKVVALSMHDSPEIQQVMREAGAEAYLSKSGPPEALAAAIRAAVREVKHAFPQR